jgi:hypothetical protein
MSGWKMIAMVPQRCREARFSIDPSVAEAHDNG